MRHRDELSELIEDRLREQPASFGLGASSPPGSLRARERHRARPSLLPTRLGLTPVVRVGEESGGDESPKLRTRCACTASPVSYRRRPPRLGEHTDEVLRELGLMSPRRLQEAAADRPFSSVDEIVPDRHEIKQGPPEALVPSSLELFNRDALLFDPGVVAEVEDPRPIVVGALKEVVLARSKEVLADDLSGGDFPEAVWPVPPERLGELTPVQGGAVGRDREDEVVRTELPAAWRA